MLCMFREYGPYLTKFEDVLSHVLEEPIPEGNIQALLRNLKKLPVKLTSIKHLYS